MVKGLMHELSICQALLDQVTSLVKANEADAVASITVRIGPLSGVEPELLQQAFSIAQANTVAAGSALVLTTLPIRVRCHCCGAESEATVNRLLCAKCQDWHTEVISGDELLLASVELIVN